MDPTNSNLHPTFLRPIPEDCSDASSTKGGFRLPQGPVTVASSVYGGNSSIAADVGDVAVSVVSSAPAVLADTPTTATHDNRNVVGEIENKPFFQCVWTRQRLRLFCGGLLLTAGVLTAIVAVGIRADEPARPPAVVTAPPPSTPPTTQAPPPEAQPEAQPDDGDIATPVVPEEPPVETVQRLDQVLQLIVPQEALEDTTTSAYKARNWLLYQDFLRDDVLATGDWRVHQRFVAAQLHFDLQGDSWGRGSATGEYLRTDLSECWWHGISCSANRNEEVVVERVYLQSNNLRGNLPETLGALTSLQELNLSNNSIAGVVPDAWFAREGQESKWPDLFWFDLSQNELSGTLPSGLWRLPVARFIYVSDNKLTGPIDAANSVARPVRLEDVWLSANRLTGSLPPWFHADALPNLDAWISWGNRLSGGLFPGDVRPPGNLTRLDFSWNQLTGTLPASLWSLSKMEYLYLDNNNFTGPLPAVTSTNGKLAEVWLNNNLLSGPIPANFGQSWPSLKRLHLQANADLTGVLGPTEARSCSSVWTALQTLRGDCTAITCSCCTNCR